MQRIELIHSMKRAYRWVGDRGIPIAWDEAQRLIARGLATEVVA